MSSNSTSRDIPRAFFFNSQNGGALKQVISATTLDKLDRGVLSNSRCDLNTSRLQQSYYLSHMRTQSSNLHARSRSYVYQFNLVELTVPLCDISGLYLLKQIHIYKNPAEDLYSLAFLVNQSFTDCRHSLMLLLSLKFSHYKVQRPFAQCQASHSPSCSIICTFFIPPTNVES